MAKRRARDPEGQFLPDDPETPDIDEAWEAEVEGTPEGTITVENNDIVAESVPAAEVESEVEAEVKPQEDPHAPAVIELRVGASESRVPEKLSKEKIEASVKEKLSRKTDSPASDPFVPMTQLENEVKDVAKSKGFPLSRGTEIGARLLARSRRNGKS